MNKPTLLLIHTIPIIIDIFSGLRKEMMPDVEFLHILDQPLLTRIKEYGRIKEQDLERLQSHAEIGMEIGVDAVLVTCSTLSPAVELINRKIRLPIYQIDEAMAVKAIQAGNRIGLIATAQTTIGPSKINLLQQAKLHKKKIYIETLLIEEAIQDLSAGKIKEHDDKIIQGIKKISPIVDVVVLAQASMARAIESGGRMEWQVPILSSPRMVLERIKDKHYPSKEIK